MLRKSGLTAAVSGAVLAAVLAAPSPAYANHGGSSSPVVGYIEIVHNAATGGPTYALFGDLATPQWFCGVTSLTPYTVTCNPTPLLPGFVYHCDVLHADAQGTSLSARVRTSLDCNGDGAYEAQTAFIGGPVYDVTWAVSTTTVTSFSCTVDGGRVPAATPDFRAGCGDPGIVRLH